MIFLPKKNVWTRYRNWGIPKYQKGILHPVGFWAGSINETITLSGTSGSPNLSTDSESSPTDALAGWRFKNDGTVERVVNSSYAQFQDGTEWNDAQDSPAGNYWIRATVDSGDSPTSGTTGSWLALSSTRTWEWLENRDGLIDFTTAGTLKIEISDESDGTPVLDTGYYRGSATQFGSG